MVAESFSEKLARLRAEKEAQGGNVIPFTPPAPVTPPLPEFKSEDIPDVLPERDESEIEMDRIVESIDILDAYAKWCGKMTPKVGSKRESIMISCPIPGHADKNPSAWINLDKQTWFCAACDQGGDAHDIAAFHFGYPVPGYKEGATFHKLREQMAESFGWRIKNVAGGQIIYKEETHEPSANGVQQQDREPAPLAPPSPAGTQHETSAGRTEEDRSAGRGDSEASDTGPVEVTPLYDYDEAEDELVIYPSIDWQAIVPENTFLYEYMKACTNDDSPEEYHFWHGLLGLGHAVGRKVTLDDSRPVYGNLLVCLLGGTGTGKSRSQGWLNQVVKEVMPYKETGTETQGTKITAIPGSGEYLIKAFSYEGRDPANSKISLGYQPVNGVVDFDELSALLVRANRQGSTLKSTIMGFADARDEVKVGSLTHGEYVAVQPFCSIIASTQPRAVRSILNKTDTASGFLNRWVFAGGPAKEREVIGGSHSNTVIDLTRAKQELKLVHGYGGIERRITLDDKALQALKRFYRTKLFPIQQKDDTDLLKRLDLLFKKIILLFTINKRADVADVETVHAAEQLFEYILECYAILNNNIGITQSSEMVTTILNTIVKHMAKTGRGASVRDLQRYLARRNYSPDQLKKSLETMVALDMVELDKPKAGSQMGRPTVRYVAVND